MQELMGDLMLEKLRTDEASASFYFAYFVSE